MSKYKVEIRRKDGASMDAKEIRDFLGKKKIVLIHPEIPRPDKDIVAGAFYYFTAQYDIAIDLYAQAKRELDLAKYTVTLESLRKDAE